MQASFDANALRHLTKSLTCLSKYSDDLIIYASREHLCFTATNSSFSAYSRFKYRRQFFSRYTVLGCTFDDDGEDVKVSGQLTMKAILAILKHRTVDKSVDRCEFNIVEGGAAREYAGEDQDSLESKLIVRLHCKHGIVKTHRLLLNTAPALMTPSMPDPINQSRVSIGGKAIKDMLEHFPVTKSVKSDPQLVWSFGDEEVILKGMESSLESRVNGQLATELSIHCAEFEAYDIYAPPITIAFHLREFFASVIYAESNALALDIKFTDPAAPLFIEADGDQADSLFVISTSQVHESDAPSNMQPQSHAESMQPRGRKRELESAEPEMYLYDDPPRGLVTPGSTRKKPMKVVMRADRLSAVRETPARDTPMKQSPKNIAMPPPSFNPFADSSPPRAPLPPASLPPASLPPLAASPSRDEDGFARPATPPLRPSTSHEPLFLPSSQLSQAASQAIRESGLGIENMDADELAAMLDDEGEEVAFGARLSGDVDVKMEDVDLAIEPNKTRESSFDLFDDIDTEMEPTQSDRGSKIFRPLFDD